MAGKGARTGVEDPKSVRGCRVLIIEARFYEDIADALVAGAIKVIEAAGAEYLRFPVPGALEIPQVLAQVIDAEMIPDGSEDDGEGFDGAVALGCVIRGETSHYDIVCENANHWLNAAAMAASVPLGNGILTVDTREQAMERAKGGAEGKGGDAARACLRLVEIRQTLRGRVGAD